MANPRMNTSMRIQMTKKESEFIRERAAYFGIAVSVYIRKLATGARFRDMPSQRAILDLYGIREALLTALDRLKAGERDRGRETGARQQLAEQVAVTVETIERLALELGGTRGRALRRTSPRFSKSKRATGSARPPGRPDVDNGHAATGRGTREHDH